MDSHCRLRYLCDRCCHPVITSASTGDPLGVIVAGRLIAGIGVGFESAIVILYMILIIHCSWVNNV
jgi:hypothetical protein